MLGDGGLRGALVREKLRLLGGNGVTGDLFMPQERGFLRGEPGLRLPLRLHERRVLGGDGGLRGLLGLHEGGLLTRNPGLGLLFMLQKCGLLRGKRGLCGLLLACQLGLLRRHGGLGVLGKRFSLIQLGEELLLQLVERGDVIAKQLALFGQLHDFLGQGRNLGQRGDAPFEGGAW